MRHLLSIADLNRDDVERILETAEALNGVDEKLPTLRGKLVLSLFFESSTRTSSSFELAAKRLSADVMSLKAAGSSVDKGESLKDTVARFLPYWHDQVVPDVLAGRRVLIAAHGNSLRALVKHLDGVSEEAIVELNIPTGIPLVYELDQDLRPLRSRYLGDPEAAKRAAQAVANQTRGQA